MPGIPRAGSLLGTGPGNVAEIPPGPAFQFLMSGHPDDDVGVIQPRDQRRKDHGVRLPVTQTHGTRRTRGAGWVILRKLRGPSPHPAQEARMTGTAKAATKRPILTLLFHEQQTGELHPGPAVVRTPGRFSSRLAADSRQNRHNRQPQSARHEPPNRTRRHPHPKLVIPPPFPSSPRPFLREFGFDCSVARRPRTVLNIFADQRVQFSEIWLPSSHLEIGSEPQRARWTLRKGLSEPPIMEPCSVDRNGPGSLRGPVPARPNPSGDSNSRIANERQERAMPLLLDCACFGGFRGSRTDFPHPAIATTGPGREPPTAAFP